MKIHIITIGKPKLYFAKDGFNEYVVRIKHIHTVRVTHLADKQNNPASILQTAGNAYKVGLVIDGGKQMSSHQLAEFLQKLEIESKEVCFIVGGPDGLQSEVIAACDYLWSFSPLTFPHDLAMVILTEAIYRACTINVGHPYHH